MVHARFVFAPASTSYIAIKWQFFLGIQLIIPGQSFDTMKSEVEWWIALPISDQRTSTWKSSFNQIDCHTNRNRGIMSPVINARETNCEFHEKWHSYLHTETADIIFSRVLFRLLLRSLLLLPPANRDLFLLLRLNCFIVLAHAILLHHTPS